MTIAENFEKGLYWVGFCRDLLLPWQKYWNIEELELIAKDGGMKMVTKDVKVGEPKL